VLFLSRAPCWPVGSRPRRGLASAAIPRSALPWRLPAGC